MPEYRLKGDETVLDVLLAAEMTATRSEGRRLVEQKGVKLDGEVLGDAMQIFPKGGVLQVGKRKFVRIIA